MAITGVRSALLDRGRLSRFLSVGLIGAVIDLSISAAILLTSTIPPEVAKFIGAEVAIIVMFLINDRWTFLESQTSGYIHGLQRLVKSNLVRSGGIGVQIAVVFILTRVGIQVLVGGTDLWPLMTMPIAIACGFIMNYTGETLITWRVHR